jgi:hypothetical protein
MKRLPVVFAGVIGAAGVFLSGCENDNFSCVLKLLNKVSRLRSFVHFQKLGVLKKYWSGLAGSKRPIDEGMVQVKENKCFQEFRILAVKKIRSNFYIIKQKIHHEQRGYLKPLPTLSSSNCNYFR